MESPTFKIADAYSFAAAKGLEVEANQIRSMVIHSAIRRPAAVRKGCLVELFESRGFIDEFVAQYWPGRHADAGERRRGTFLDQKLLNERLLRGEPLDEDAVEEASGMQSEELSFEAGQASFALEAQLRDFIAQNLPRIPIHGRCVTLYTDPAGRVGIEYPTGVGPINILAVDDSGNFVVFELKLERGPDRALGQLARYMGWVKLNLAREREVSGVVVAKLIDERLRYAAYVIPNVALLRVNLDLWYPRPPMKGGHSHGHVTVRRSPDPPARGARFDQSHRERVAAVGPPI
jgi:hypothetical protein